MGKPSSTQLSTQSDSNKSNKKNRSKHKIKKNISTQKMDTMKKKKRNRNRKNIRKLFQKLKNDSMKTSTTDTTQDSVILLDSSANNTVESLNNTVIPQNKRKSPIIFSNSNKKKREDSNSSLIIINDDLKTNAHSSRILSPKSSNSNNSHVNCSTPITKRDSGTIKRMIINNFCPPSSSNVKPKCEEIVNLDETDTTKIINRDSYLTIDLTSDSDVIRSETGNNENEGYCTMETQDCTLVSVSDASVSMSGDSDVTVIQNRRKEPKNKEIQRFANGISNLNSSEKGKLLMLITKKILNGCNMPSDIKESLNNIRTSVSRSIETVEDTYIREVILGETKQPGQVSQVKSRNSIGSNIYHPKSDSKNRTGLRMIVIDGSNVAMDHKKGKSFSVQGLKICIDYFVKRGHTVKAFVPRFRCKYGKSSDPRLLDILERQGLVVYTPSREIQGKMCSPYDDRYIVQCAAEFDGVIVSGDNYRDLLQENPRWRFVIENRLLQFTWVDDMIMFPRDPLGRNGPTLEEFLKHTEITEAPIVL